MRRLVLVVAWSSLIAGCSFSTRIGAGAGDDVASGDGGIDGPPRVRPPEGACGKPGTISDDFADGQRAPFWRVTRNGEVVEADGTIAVTPMTGELAGYHATAYVDLREASAEVEIRTMLETGTGAIAFFRFIHGGNQFGISVSDGMISMGVPSQIMTIPYDPVAHRHLRVSHAATMLGFWTSPDGVSWEMRHSAPAPNFTSAVSIELGATNPNGAPSPGTVTFAEFNTYVAPAQWCAVTSLVDPFDDGQIDVEWAVHGHTSSGCIEYENASAARVDQNGTAACDAYFGSSSLYKLTNTAMTVRVPAITTFATGWITYFGAWDVTDQKFGRMYFEGNQLCADGTSIPKTCVAYSTTRDVWRIRETAGTLYFETGASTSTTFTLVFAVPTPFPMDGVRAYFGTLTDRAINQNIGLNVDRFN